MTLTPLDQLKLLRAQLDAAISVIESGLQWSKVEMTAWNVPPEYLYSLRIGDFVVEQPGTMGGTDFRIIPHLVNPPPTPTELERIYATKHRAPSKKRS